MRTSRNQYRQARAAPYAFLGFQHGSDPAKRKLASPDGWGVGCYPDDGLKALVVKEASPAHLSELAGELKRGKLPPSGTHIMHIRRRSEGAAPASEVNTHPFMREVSGRHYVFAHNGFFKREVAVNWATGPFFCHGETQSERAFCHLLACHELLLREQRWDELETVLRQMNQSGDANCLLTDGSVLMVYSDMRGYKNLSWVERRAPYGPITLADDDTYRVDLKLSTDQSRLALLFATRPVTVGEEWAKLPAGRLLVVKQGGFVRGPH